MKNNHVPRTAPAYTATKSSAGGRFQVYCQSRAGNYSLGFNTDSDAEAIKAFMLQVPTFQGGEIRILDQAEQRMVAFVRWKMATTEIGLPIFHRVNVFHDWHLAMIACDLLKQEKIRDTVEMRF